MGMDLGGKGGYFRFSNATWKEVLMLAYDQGWKPAGTEMPRYIFLNQDDTVHFGHTKACWEAAKDWEGMDCFSNSFQWVTDEDAANIADALERALEGDEELNVDYLREFIAFCRAGGFSIA